MDEADCSGNVSPVHESTDQVENEDIDETAATNKEIKSTTSTDNRLVKLPLSRVRSIMKMDPDCQLLSQDAVVVATKATELFIEMVSLATYEQTTQSKKKTLLMPDFDKVIKAVPSLCFLDGMMEF